MQDLLEVFNADDYGKLLSLEPKNFIDSMEAMSIMKRFERLMDKGMTRDDALIKLFSDWCLFHSTRLMVKRSKSAKRRRSTKKKTSGKSSASKLGSSSSYKFKL